MCNISVHYVYYVRKKWVCVYVYPDRQTELVDVRQEKRNMLRQTNKNGKKRNVGR